MSVIHIDRNNFQSEVLDSDRPSCWTSGPPGAPLAGWWAPSWTRSPGAERHQGRQGQRGRTAGAGGQFGVMSIPTLVVVKEGRIVQQAMGARPKAQILSML